MEEFIWHEGTSVASRSQKSLIKVVGVVSNEAEAPIGITSIGVSSQFEFPPQLNALTPTNAVPENY